MVSGFAIGKSATPDKWSKDIYQLFIERTGRASMVLTSNRDTAEWLRMFDDVLLAQSAIDRFVNTAYDLVIEGESYRPRLKPKLESDAAPDAPAENAKLQIICDVQRNYSEFLGVTLPRPRTAPTSTSFRRAWFAQLSFRSVESVRLVPSARPKYT